MSQSEDRIELTEMPLPPFPPGESDDDESALTQVVRDELEYLWNDLNTATQYALNGSWSIQCDGLTDRIKTLTQIVGPTHWEKIQIRLLETGVYQRIHDELGVQIEPPDMQVVREMRERFSG